MNLSCVNLCVKFFLKRIIPIKEERQLKIFWSTAVFALAKFTRICLHNVYVQTIMQDNTLILTKHNKKQTDFMFKICAHLRAILVLI